MQLAVNRAYDSYKRGAAVKNREFSLSKERFTEIVIQDCLYCGKTASPINGIDRLINSVGYVEGNMAPCCSVCNYRKGACDFQEFKEWVTVIASRLAEAE